MSAPLIEPVATPALLPLARFGVVFGWGLRRALRTRKFLVTIVIAALAGAGLGASLAGQADPARALWEFIHLAVLGTAVPLIALGLVGGGYGEEIQDQTLVFHLVRPVSRSTVYFARYAAGAVPGALCAALMALLALVTSGVSLPTETIVGTVAVAVLGVVTIGAVYYALASLFRRGLVAGLVYTFVVEGFFQLMPGSIQRLALTHHVRSVFHRLADDAFSALSPRVANDVAAHASGIVTPRALRASLAEPWTSVEGALLLCGGVVLAALVLGAWTIRRRDYALKD